MTHQFFPGLYATPKTRSRIVRNCAAYLPLGTEVTFGGVDRQAYCKKQKIERGERLVISRYEYTGTPKHQRITISFDVPAILECPANENFSPNNVENTSLFDQRPANSNIAPAQRKYIELDNLYDLRVLDVQSHIIASSDEFERHMIDGDLVHHLEERRSFRPTAVALWKDAGRGITAALLQNQSMRRKHINDVAPLLFTESHAARPSYAKNNIVLPFDHFKISVVSLT